MIWRGLEIDGAIFDMDGTLVDSMQLWSDLADLYVIGKGFEPVPGLRNSFWDQGTEKGCAYLRDTYGITDDPEAVLRDMNGIAERFYREQVEEKAGIRKILEELRAGGVRMCVASATDEEVGRYALERTGLDTYFERYFCCKEIGAGKESDQIYQAARKWLGTEAGKTLVFEDALYAARTVSAAGFRLVGVWDQTEPGQRELEELSEIYLVLE